ncbi:MAG: SRPBCC domain-containing protein [Chitinophagaceae bacterium]
MKPNLITRSNIRNNTPVSKVWEALTRSEIIKQYFFGTDVKSDGKVRSLVTNYRRELMQLILRLHRIIFLMNIQRTF